MLDFIADHWLLCAFGGLGLFGVVLFLWLGLRLANAMAEDFFGPPA